MAVSAVLYLLCLRAYYVGFFNDDAFHLIGARSLWSLRYAELSAAGEPPLVNYFPGFSILLMPFAFSTTLCQLASVALTLLGLWCFSRLLEDPWALALAALTPLTASMSGTLLSDVPLLAGTMAALLLWKRRRWGAAAAVAGFCALLRPTGCVVSLALGLQAALDREWRRAAVTWGAAVLFAGPFLLRNRLLSGTSLVYFKEFGDGFAANVAGNAAYYLKFVFVTMLFRFPWPHDWLTAATVGAGLIAAAYGVRRGAPALFAGLFIAVHLFWSKQAGRYLLPVLPLLFAFFLAGLERLAGKKAARAAAVAALLLLAVPAARIVEASWKRSSPLTRPPERTLAWIAANTPADAVFAVELDGRFHVLTGRKTVPLRRFLRGESAPAGYAAVFPNSFALTTAKGGAFNDPLSESEALELLSDPRKYRLVFSDAGEQSAVFSALDGGRARAHP